MRRLASSEVLPALRAALLMSLLLAAPGTGALAQGRQEPGAIIGAQRKAMDSLAFMDGVWRGQAWTILASGEKHNVTQTERIGPFLDGAVKVIEGRGYSDDGKVAFNAFGIVSYDPAKKAYTLRSYAQGRSGDFPFTPTASGYVWEIPAGPVTIRYTCTVKDDTWHEVGDRLIPGKEPARIFEMTLSRIGNTDWPAAGAVSPK